MSIKKKLLSSFLAIIGILLISEGFFITMNYILLSKYMALSNNMISEYRLIGDTTSLVNSFNKLTKSSTDNIEIERFNQLSAYTKSSLITLSKVIVDSESKLAFIGLENNINDILFDIEIGISNLKTGNYLQAINRYEAASRKNSFVRENTINLLLYELEYAKDLQIELENVRKLGQIIAIILFTITVGGCIWYAIVFSKRLILPLLKLTKLAKAIEDGNLAVEVDKKLFKGNDEVATLAHSFNTMVISLRRNIKQLQEFNLEIKRSRNYLKAERNKLQQYLDIAGVIVLVSDYNNKVLLINKKGCEILNINAAELIGKNWINEYVAKKYQLQTSGFLAYLIANTASMETLENVVVSRDKLEKNIVWHFSILKDENNLPPAILATGVDVTELTKAKMTISQLKEVDKLKNEVLNIATHELKTPLISVVGLSEVMEKQPKNIPPEYQNFISIIHSEGLKLTNLIKTMLTASRNEVGKTAAVKEEFDLVNLVSSLQTSLSMLAKRTDSEIEFNLQEKSVNLNSDKAKISQVIYNFVDNAVKYGPKEQTIVINLFKPDTKSVQVEVKGAGHGISKELQKNLFKKFSQLEPSLSRSQDGMGLGLYICKQNIENLGGQIGVKSELDQGSTFYFTLPLI